MKKLLFPLIATLIFIGIAFALGSYFLKWLSAPASTPTTTSQTTFPSGVSTSQQPATPASPAEQAAITQDFHTQTPDSGNLVLQDTATVDDYAAATWGDENIGGTVILKRDSSGNWKVLLMDGGVLTQADLVAQGIPAADALSLVESQTTHQ